MSLAKKINSMLSQVKSASATKQASTVAGTDAVQAEQDPGFVRGQTSHPSKDVDAGTIPGKLGFRGTEYETDIKKDQPVGVDSLSPSSPGGDQDSRQLNIGMRQSAVGEDASVEKRYKGKPDDSPTTSPANVEEIGQKYASMSPSALIKLASAKLSNILAMVISDPSEGNKTASYGKVNKEAFEAGRQLADIATKQAQATPDAYKTKHLIAEVTRDAMAKAAAVIEYVSNFAQLKRAVDEMPPEGMVPPPGEGTEGAGPGGEMPPMPPMPEHSGEGEEMGGDVNGEPPAPDGEMHDEAGGEDGHAGAVDELISSLIEAGISPEELLSAVSDETGGAAGTSGGDADMPGGEGPTKVASAMKLEHRYQWLMLSKAAAARHRTPKFSFKVAQPGQHRERRDKTVEYIREICKR